eukprot:68654-Chlamydomonas_euryale.AAC.1
MLGSEPSCRAAPCRGVEVLKVWRRVGVTLLVSGIVSACVSQTSHPRFHPRLRPLKSLSPSTKHPTPPHLVRQVERVAVADAHGCCGCASPGSGPRHFRSPPSGCPLSLSPQTPPTHLVRQVKRGQVERVAVADARRQVLRDLDEHALPIVLSRNGIRL